MVFHKKLSSNGRLIYRLSHATSQYKASITSKMINSMTYFGVISPSSGRRDIYKIVKCYHNFMQRII
jgi:hypothetical protein